MQGRSFTDVVQSGKTEHRDELLIEHNEAFPVLGLERPARVRSLVTRNWRYTLYGGENWGELYDLAADPHETGNLWDDPAHASTRARLAERLGHNMAAIMDTSPRANRFA